MFGLFYRNLVCKKTALVIGISVTVFLGTLLTKFLDSVRMYIVTLVIGIGYGFLGTLCCGGSEIQYLVVTKYVVAPDYTKIGMNYSS